METTTKFWLGKELFYSMEAYIPWLPVGATLGLPIGEHNSSFEVVRYHTAISEHTITIHIAIK
jgi:hypothetical protein